MTRTRHRLLIIAGGLTCTLVGGLGGAIVADGAAATYAMQDAARTDELERLLETSAAHIENLQREVLRLQVDVQTLEEDRQ